jgi:hypothetical protein
LDTWIDRLAAALSEEPLTPAETGAILKLSREVAHGVERRLAPLSAYLVGVSVGRAAASGRPRPEAAADTVASAAALVPPAPPS